MNWPQFIKRFSREDNDSVNDYIPIVFHGREYFDIGSHSWKIAGQEFNVYIMCSLEIKQASNFNVWFNSMQPYLKEAHNVLQILILSNGVYPIRDFPTKNLFFLFDDDPDDRTMGSSAFLKNSRNPYEGMFIKINFYMISNSVAELSIHRLLFHEFSHPIIDVHENGRAMTETLINHSLSILKREYESEEDWIKLYEEISEKTCNKILHDGFDVKKFYLDYFYIGESWRKRFFNYFLDVAIGIFGLRLRAFKFLENTVVEDRNRLVHGKIILEELIKIKDALHEKGFEEDFINDILNLLAYLVALYTIPLHVSGTNVMLRDIGTTAKILKLTKEEYQKLLKIKVEISDLLQNGNNLREEIFKLCKDDKVKLDFYFIQEAIVRAVLKFSTHDILTKDVISNRDIDKTIFHEKNYPEMKQVQSIYFSQFHELVKNLKRHLN